METTKKGLGFRAHVCEADQGAIIAMYNLSRFQVQVVNWEICTLTSHAASCYHANSCMRTQAVEATGLGASDQFPALTAWASESHSSLRAARLPGSGSDCRCWHLLSTCIQSSTPRMNSWAAVWKFPKTRGPQYRPQNTIVLIYRDHQKGITNFGNYLYFVFIQP